MKITNQEIINIFEALDSLGNKELPILLTYRVVDNLDKLLKAYEVYRKAMLKAKNNEEIQELLNIEREVDLESFSKQELVEAGVTLTPVQLIRLRRLIDG